MSGRKIETSPPSLPAEQALYEAFGKIPSIGKAWMTGKGDKAMVTLEISQKDVPGNAVRKSAVHFSLDNAFGAPPPNSPGASDSSNPFDAPQIETFSSMCMENFVFTCPSPTGEKTVVVKKAVGDDKGSVIQIWNRAVVEYELVVPEKLHGPVINDGWFGNRASWSPCERFVAYVAERPKRRQTPEWGSAMETKDLENAEEKSEKKDEIKAKEKTWRGVGEFDEDWGEGNTGKQAPVVFVLDVEARTVTIAVEPSPDKSYGQPVWSPLPPGDQPYQPKLVFVRWDHASSIFPNMTQRLGIVYCFNRPCEMMVCDWSRDGANTAQRIDTGLKSSFSPRFANSRDLVFLSQENAVESGTHSATPVLYVTEAAPNPQTRTGLDSFDRIRRFIPDQHDLGMYATVLPDAPALCGETLFATIQWGSRTAVVSIECGLRGPACVFRVSPDPDENNYSWSFVGASANGWVMIQASAPNKPCELYVQYVPLSNDATGYHVQKDRWRRIHLPGVTTLESTVAEALSSIRTSVERITTADAGTHTVGYFEATLIGDPSSPRPTLLVPHGGPHTAYSTQFIPSISFLAACGYNVLTVNYRGSTGFNEEFLQSLPGRIGTADVQDCMSALHHFIAEGAVDRDQVAVVGGSHGGFLTGHLIGQYPDTFKAAVMRNPVCNISLMVELTDISDWCYIETFGSKEGFARAKTRNTRDDLIEMELKSPVHHIDNVTAPVLMLLGACDRRVPMDDGKRYIARLKQSDHAPETRIIVFEKDEHGLVRPQTDYEQWITCLWWLRRHGCGGRSISIE